MSCRLNEFFCFDFPTLEETSCTTNLREKSCSGVSSIGISWQRADWTFFFVEKIRACTNPRQTRIASIWQLPLLACIPETKMNCIDSDSIYINTYVVSNTARVGDVIKQLKNRRGLPCDERAELHDGRPYGCKRLGNYSVGPPEAPSGFVHCWLCVKTIKSRLS